MNKVTYVFTTMVTITADEQNDGTEVDLRIELEDAIHKAMPNRLVEVTFEDCV